MCPELKASSETELTQINTYIDRYIFNIIFKTLYNKLELDPLDTKHEDSFYQLIHAHTTIIAQGDEIYMNKLKDGITDLVRDEYLKKIIESYRDLHDRLRVDRLSWENKLMDLYHLVNGRKPLEGNGACELCPS
jgi:hypothetical protein